MTMITKRRDVAILQDIRQFIEQNFHKEIPIGSIVKQFNLNRTKLQEGFRQFYDLPIHAFIHRLRMEKAKDLLRSTDDSVKSIALETGYKSTSSFIRAFRQEYGIAPTEFRKQAGE